MKTLSVFLKRLVLPSENCSLDVDLRYLPVVRFLQSHFPEATVLEVGSSSIGITPYLNRSVVGVDTVFPEPVVPQLVPVISKGPLPFRNQSFDAVVAMDTFEHVPREYRQSFINEAIRTSRKLVVLGFPEGEGAERHDAKMEQYYTRLYGEPHHYFVEHRTYGVPRRQEVEAYLDEAKKQTARDFTVSREKNVNIFLRSLFIRLIWHPSRMVHVLYFLLTILSRWDRLFHFGRCYRAIYFITLKSSG